MKRIVVWAVCAWCAGATAFGREDPDDRSILRAAEEAFDRGVEIAAESPERARDEFRLSAAAYLELVEGRGRRNARLLANLGNAALMAGDTGRAILSFRRALRIDPGDRVVQAGLDHARAQVAVAVSEPADGLPSRLTAWTWLCRPRTMVVFSITAWAAGWITLAVARAWPRARRLRGPGAAGAILGACGLALAVTEEIVRFGESEAVVMEQTAARNGPDSGAYAPAFDAPLPPGVEVAILEHRGGWVRVRLADGRDAWVPVRSIEKI